MRESEEGNPPRGVSFMNEHFDKLKSNLELDPTLAETVSTRHNAIRTYLQNNLADFKDSKLIGSLQRRTRIDPTADQKFDIDILVVMGEFYNWLSSGGVSPQQAVSRLHATVHRSARYSSMDPVQDPPTVTLTGADNIEVQLVPAYVDMIGRDQLGNELGWKGRGYWVAKGGTWQMADYDFEADYISAKNKESAGHLIPTIKILKAIKRRHFPALESFPLEIVAANVVPLSIGVKQALQAAIYMQDLLLDFFDYAGAHLTNPIQVPGSKSSPIFLDPTNATALTERFKAIGNHIRAANQLSALTQRVDAWRRLCGDHFPVRIN
jgi:hypothetical protein